MTLYEVKLIWRYRPLGLTKKRPSYDTMTVGVLAHNAFSAAAMAANQLSKDGDVDRVRARVRHAGRIAHGEPNRRCRHDRWDGHPGGGEFLPVELKQLPGGVKVFHVPMVQGEVA